MSSVSHPRPERLSVYSQMYRFHHAAALATAQVAEHGDRGACCIGPTRRWENHISASGAGNYMITASDIHPGLFNLNDLRFRHAGGQKPLHSMMVWRLVQNNRSGIDEKDWTCENVTGDMSHEPPSLTKEPVQMATKENASAEPLISRHAHDVPVMVFVRSAYLAVHLK